MNKTNIFFLFWRGNERIKGHKPENTVLSSNQGENIFCTLETNDDRRRLIRTAFFFFGEATGGTNATTLTQVSWVPVAVKTNVLGSRDYIFL
jgi:hypothetical protein